MTRRLLVVAIGAVLLLGAPAAGAPRWGAPAQISTGDRALGPELALNASGDGLVVWDQEVGADCPTQPAALSCIHVVTAAARAGGSRTWQQPIEIARPGVGATPRAAIDDNGNAAIVWVHDIGRDRVLQATYRHGPTGSWPEPNDISEPSLEVRNHEIALDAVGNTVAVWAERPTTSFVIRGATRSAVSGAWGAAVALSHPGRNASGGPRMAVTPSGQVVAAWIEDGIVRSARGDATTGTWDPPIDVAGSVGGAAAVDPMVAVNAAGEAAVVWVQRLGSGNEEVQAAFRLRVGDWTSQFGLGSARTSFAATPQVAVDGAGNVVAAWLSRGGVQAAVRSSTAGVWNGPVVVSTDRTASSMHMAMNAAGNAIAVWVAEGSRVVQAAIKPRASGDWQPATELPSSGTSAPRVAMSVASNAIAVWNRSSSQRVVVESSVLAGSGPVLAGMTVPRRAIVVGARARFSVRPVAWAAPLVGEPLWRFGDGSS